MPYPLFYEENLPDNGSFPLSEETSRHIIQVLRMKNGQPLQLTNGKGQTNITEIVRENKKTAEVKIISTSNVANPVPQISIAISLIKNKNRFEWFLEKATEIGVQHIIPMMCERTEKEHFRLERMHNILISAMLQSKQAWLPRLTEPVKYSDLVKGSSQPNRFIAYCNEEEKNQLRDLITIRGDRIILIGPEGDFTKAEIELAIENNFIPVTLGETRLRTETAGIVSCVMLNQVF